MGASARTPVVAAIAAALGLTIGGAVVAIASPSTTTITACVTKSSGAMRLQTPSTPCKSQETAVTWNQAGAPGQDGADGVSGYEIVTNDKVPGVGFLGEGAFCPAGKKVVGGGASPIDANGNEVTLNTFNLLDSYPVNDGTAWSAAWTLTSNPFADDVRVFAICINAG